MVTARLAIGSVSTLAFGALLIGSAPFWMHRGAAGSRPAPWGAIAALDASRAEAAPADDRTQLLKLAALKSGAPADAAPAGGSAQPDPKPAPQAAAPDSQPAPPAVALATPAPAEQPLAPPQQTASLETPASVDPVGSDGAKPDRININTASTSALDHLPGAGRIGRAIVSHRPYSSVKDLLSRRVLRTSDFQKIQSHISID